MIAAGKSTKLFGIIFQLLMKVFSKTLNKKSLVNPFSNSSHPTLRVEQLIQFACKHFFGSIFKQKEILQLIMYR